MDIIYGHDDTYGLTQYSKLLPHLNAGSLPKHLGKLASLQLADDSHVTVIKVQIKVN